MRSGNGCFDAEVSLNLLSHRSIRAYQDKRQYDEQYALYLKERPWNSRGGNWTGLAADFYKPPYEHYPEVPAMQK
ncbi:MAG TPA: hypothetical protein H9873_02915 [Candidatus Dorea gallistercoris]|uniref:Uncharacterized protein n=1 Tax=Candidatus Dorea gallistercoris TaxID=2838542 RepID=A0A9D1RAT9_9FIRM|nr:hypothetical protein [Candidatus Dorea gallistercoris]